MSDAVSVSKKLVGQANDGIDSEKFRSRFFATPDPICTFRYGSKKNLSQEPRWLGVGTPGHTGRVDSYYIDGNVVHIYVHVG